MQIMHYSTMVKQFVLNVFQQQADALQKLRSMDGMTRNFILLKVMYEAPVAYIMADVPSLTLDGMWASLGGVLSLWLGINIMTAMELVEFIYIAIKSYVNLKKSSAVNSVEDIKA